MLFAVIQCVNDKVGTAKSLYAEHPHSRLELKFQHFGATERVFGSEREA